MLADGEFFNQREDVGIIGQKILIFLVRSVDWREGTVVQHMKLTVDLEFGDEMRTLEVRPQVAVLGDVGQELEGHQDVLVTRHRRQDTLSSGAITEVQRVGTGDESGRVGVVGGIRRRQAQSTIGLPVFIVDDTPINARAVGYVERLGILTLGRVGYRQIIRVGDLIQHWPRVLHAIDLHLVLNANNRFRRLARVIIIAHGRVIAVPVVRIARRGLLLPQCWTPGRGCMWIAPQVQRTAGGSRGIRLRGNPSL